MRKVLNPLQWTAVTWFAVSLWLYGAIPLNYPPSVSYEMDAVTGELVNPTSYTKLQDYPFPIGWPLHYVEPDNPFVEKGRMGRWLRSRFPGVPLPPIRPSIVPGESSVLPFAAAVNASLILLTLFCLVYFSQTLFPQFSLLAFLALPALYCIYRLCAYIISRGMGYDAYWYYDVAVYFSPLLLATLYAFRVGPFRRMSTVELRAIQDGQ